MGKEDNSGYCIPPPRGGLIASHGLTCILARVCCIFEGVLWGSGAHYGLWYGYINKCLLSLNSYGSREAIETHESH